MCEILVGRGLPDDFSLLNAALPDASVKILGSDAGFTLGNSDQKEAVHRLVDELLRNDSGSPIRQQVIPIKVIGPHRTARGEMAARIRLALRQAKRVTIIPCDGWGAPGWFRLEGWQMDIVSNDYQAKYGAAQRYTITLDVDAWAKAEERYTAHGSNALPALTLWEMAVGGVTGWSAINGALDNGTPTYVGVTSDGSSATKDGLELPLDWDPNGGGYSLIRIEAKVNPASGIEVGGGGGIYPALFVQGRKTVDGEWVTAASALASRTDLTTGWYAETLLFAAGLPPMDRIRITAFGGDPADQDLKIRAKIELKATNTFASGAAVMYLNIPGSEPTDVDLEITRADAGVLVYTAPVFADFPDYSPMVGPGPEGVYHLVIDRSGGTATNLNVTIDGVLHRTITLAALPYGDTGFISVASDIVVSPTRPVAVAVTGADGTLQVRKTLWLWMEDVLNPNGPTGDYTMTGPSGGGTPSLKINARTPERPVPSYTINGIQDDDIIRAAGDHFIEPGMIRVFAAWAGNAAPAGADFTASLHPAFHTDVPTSTRWFAS